MVLFEKSVRAGKARIRGCADHDFKIGESVLEFLDDGLCSVDLTDADGVEPNAFPARISAPDLAESLGPAGPVAVVSNSSIYYDRTVRKPGQQVQQIQHESHLVNLQKTKLKQKFTHDICAASQGQMIADLTKKIDMAVEEH